MCARKHPTKIPQHDPISLKINRIWLVVSKNILIFDHIWDTLDILGWWSCQWLKVWEGLKPPTPKTDVPITTRQTDTTGNFGDKCPGMVFSTRVEQPEIWPPKGWKCQTHDEDDWCRWLFGLRFPWFISWNMTLVMIRDVILGWSWMGFLNLINQSANVIK